MPERKAIYYGQVTIIHHVVCDGYVLDDGTAVLSERGTAKLLGMDHRALKIVETNWPPEKLKPFIDNNVIVETNFIEVTAKNSPHKGRKIMIYTSAMVETLITAYASAFAHRVLKNSQKHIGERCVNLACSLIRTALEAAIKEACGVKVNIQQTAQKHYSEAVQMMQDAGMSCSVKPDIATKKDIVHFLHTPLSTLNSFLRKYKWQIKPIRLTEPQIRSIGSYANRMNGYHLEDVAKIVFSMDSEIGMDLKKKAFGTLGDFITPETKDEIQWRKSLSRVFQGFGLRYNYQIGPYRIDFFVEKLLLVLECNGYCHKYYDAQAEAKREQFLLQRGYGLIRFHHQVSLEALCNAVLQCKPREVIRLYDAADIMAS